VREKIPRNNYTQHHYEYSQVLIFVSFTGVLIGCAVVVVVVVDASFCSEVRLVHQKYCQEASSWR